jgi:hypothetical protein
MVFTIFLIVWSLQFLTMFFFGFYRFDFSVNWGRVVIEQAFGSLKNRWRILKAFNMYVKKTALVTLACCVLHNYCEIHNHCVPILADVRLRCDPHVGFHVGRMQLPHEGVAAKVA